MTLKTSVTSMALWQTCPVLFYAIKKALHFRKAFFILNELEKFIL